jgi:hypothetical protein
MYWISSRGHLTRGGSPAWGLGKVQVTPHHKKIRNVTHDHRNGRILWNDVVNGKNAYFCIFMSRHQMKGENIIYWLLIFSLKMLQSSYTRVVRKVRELTLLLRVGTLWRSGDGLFFEILLCQAMNFLQRYTHFSKTCCRPLIASKYLALELPFHGWKSPESHGGEIRTVWWMF